LIDGGNGGKSADWLKPRLRSPSGRSPLRPAAEEGKARDCPRASRLLWTLAARHSVASMWIASGWGVKVVSELIGHT
jgi:hypothetical protein